MENTKFLTDRNRRPNIQVPDGCKLHFNETMGRWVLRNCKGFSAKFLKKNSFVPHSKYEEVAIEVGSYKNIPVDYDGVMGVPISYLQHHNPNQFQIVGAYNYSKDYNGKTWNAKLFGKYKYKRLLIKKVSELKDEI